MKKWFLYVLAFLAVMLLAACGTNPPKYITEVQNNYIVVEPPKKLYEPVKRLKPPYSKVYVDASWEEKEKMLFDYIGRQDLQIDHLSTDRASIGTWVIEQRAKVPKEKVPK